MPGPLPKNPKTRQRRNKTTTRASFVDDGNARPDETPELPAGFTWHDLTRQWWEDVWASPMRDEYLRMDVHGLYRLAFLVNKFWLTGDDKMAGEIRLQGIRYGQDPMSRRALQWEVMKVEEAEQRKSRRHPRQVVDPRDALRVVS